ncbi:ciliogenesis and planar polarity effector 2 [Amia ocellicauda]|uniref:ciliogenesis and planar polarity effector 2 n=1 Tax=Amia ocellicauda TaxID=2972642 RepID=UPI003463A3D9
MARLPVPGSLLVPDWHLSPDSEEYFRRSHRKRFGLLDAPVLPPQLAVDTVGYKVFLCGKSGVGKTALAAHLAGQEVPSLHHETTGIQTSVVLWPAMLRASGRVLLFRLQLWDCGENALRRFDHLLPACKDQADAVLFLFSFTDRTSFDDLSNQIARGSDPSDSAVQLVVGTKFDLFMHSDVTEREVRDFQQVWGVPVFRVQSGGATVGLEDIAPLLTTLAERLWHRDMQAAGLCAPPQPEPTHS